MYVNGLTFLTSVDRQIRYRTAIYIASRSRHNYIKAMKDIINVYHLAGFKIKTIMADPEFMHIFNELQHEYQIKINITNAQDHVPEAERNIRTIKERVCAQYHLLPYNNIPRVMIKYLVMESARKLNFFLRKEEYPNITARELFFTSLHLNTANIVLILLVHMFKLYMKVIQKTPMLHA